MTFSTDWEEQYKARTNLSKWPWSDVVSLVMRYVRPIEGHGLRVLEVGCGAGANIPFFRDIEADYCAVDGSDTIIKELRGKFSEYAENLSVGDFTAGIPFDGPFDLVLDRCAIPCNNIRSIKNVIASIGRVLSPDGFFIGIDWFSTQCDEFSNGGVFVDDDYTKYKFEDGQFASLGKVHFFTQEHISELLFSDFEIVMLERKDRTTVTPEQRLYSTWNVVAKPKK